MNENNNRLNELITELQKLIDISLRESENIKKVLGFLFKQLERAQNLREYRKDPALLAAYLTLSGFTYRKTITEEKLIERINKEVELVRPQLKSINQSNQPEEMSESDKKIVQEFLKKHNWDNENNY